MNDFRLPAYVISAVAAVWFAVMAHRFRKGVLLCCIGGAILGLCVSTICLGLANAVTLPYMPSELDRMKWVGIAASVVAIGIVGAAIEGKNRVRAWRAELKFT